MKDIEVKAKEVNNGIKSLARKLDLDEGVLLHFILNTPEANIKLLQSRLKSKESIKSFILGWEYVEDVLDSEILRLLEKC